MRFMARASGAGHIMTDPKKGSKDPLSKTAQKYVREQWVADKYGRHRELTSKAITKGILNEEQAITMLSIHLDDFIVKNQEHKANEWVKGTADIIHDGVVYDLKCSYDIWTFMEAEVTDLYEWQLRTYMALYDVPRACLAYVLTDAPDSVIDAEVRSAIWKMDSADVDVISVRQAIAHQLAYPDIEAKDKLKLFYLEHDPARMEELYQRVELCRDYYNTLHL